MNKLTLIGQPIIDYLCKSNLDLITQFNLRQNEVNLIPFQEIDDLLRSADIIFKDIGGCVTNTSIGLSKLSMKHTLAYSIGEDENADFYKLAMLKFPFIQAYIQIQKNNTAVVATMVDLIDKNTPRTSIFNHGCSNSIALDSRLKNAILPDTLIYISLFSFFDNDSENLFEIIDYAKKENAHVILDAGGIKAIPVEKMKRILPYSNGIIANYFEIDYIQNNIGLSLDELSVNRWIVAKNGDKPTEFYSGGEKQFSIAPIPAKVVNCLGAGDAFAAGFLSTYLMKKDYQEAIIKGNMFAGRVVRQEKFH